MQRYTIEIVPQAEKAIRKLPRELRERIDRAILTLANDPRPSGVTKLTGYTNQYRIRVGDWRIRYAIEDDKLLVLVLVVLPRDKAYRH